MKRAVRLAKALSIALLTMVVSIAIPGLHFVLGPLSPLLGGFVAGAVCRLRGEEAVLLGVFEALLAGIGVGILLPDLAHLTLGVATLWFFGLFAAVYAGLLGGVAAYISGRQARTRG
ncbi:hypothetical protein NET03_04195 [Thermomicrobium sp. CFH 73360]|uniref:hypothetical protein n=1 Tax=Thermomicrobium sp. CFH 73360 TaxID=2951987 RepID=UPI00207675C1|nr:hypothetical protein [Thermomicrobium sp. CFH 73360]MCM8745722.1 hypothetical protein [Thermomicrobium sp. CFH 73360]